MESKREAFSAWDGTPPEPLARSENWSFLAAFSLGTLLLSLGVLFIALWQQDWVLVVLLTIGFLLSIVAVASGVLARHYWLPQTGQRGDFLAFLAVVLGQAILLLYFLMIVPHAFPAVFAYGVFAAWAGMLVIYAVATATPPVKMGIICAIFALPILSIAAVGIHQSRIRSRQRQVEYNLQRVGESLRQEIDEGPVFRPSTGKSTQGSN